MKVLKLIKLFAAIVLFLALVLVHKIESSIADSLKDIKLDGVSIQHFKIKYTIYHYYNDDTI